MTQPKYIPPSIDKEAFHCPLCQVYARQHHSDVYDSITRSGFRPVSHFAITLCSHCNKPTFWHEKQIIYPLGGNAEPPNPDLPEDITNDYNEARSILDLSPRGAAALLRLCIQKLCILLEEPGKNINDDIKSLVAKGLPVLLQQALDIVRIKGNNAVHPGELDLRDDRETVGNLFRLVNLIAENRITEPKNIAAMFDTLPDTTKEAIKKRDNK